MSKRKIKITRNTDETITIKGLLTFGLLDLIKITVIKKGVKE